MKKFLEEFKKFALRGNVIDMAVGVIIGGAFTSVVNAVSNDFIKPILSFVTSMGAEGGPTWGMMADGETAWSLAAAGADFGTTIINFIITAFVLFLIIKAMNKLSTLGKKPEAPKAPTTKKCPYCLSEIPIGASKCAHCASELPEEA